MDSLVKASGLDDTTIANLGKKIDAFEKSLTPQESQAWNTATKNAVENAGASALFGDPEKKAELDTYLRSHVGVNPSADAPGSITSVIVTVAVHC